jgi:predicted transcriptional regulator YheO
MISLKATHQQQIFPSRSYRKAGEKMAQNLDFLKQLAHGMAVQFGSSCEVVIHDLSKKDLENSIVHIENGHVSNRHTGDGPSGIVLETLRTDPEKLQDRLAYLTRTEDGRILKSSTLYIRDEKGRVNYLFSINYDITTLLAAETTIKGLMKIHHDEDEKEKSSDSPQKITHSVTELLDMLIEQAIARIGKPVALMTKDDKVAVVQYLNNAGAFLITKSGDKVSSLLGISKFTLYSYMDKG